jgi:hypothetical protein
MWCSHWQYLPMQCMQLRVFESGLIVLCITWEQAAGSIDKLHRPHHSVERHGKAKDIIPRKKSDKKSESWLVLIMVTRAAHLRLDLTSSSVQTVYSAWPWVFQRSHHWHKHSQILFCTRILDELLCLCLNWRALITSNIIVSICHIAFDRLRSLKT